MDAENQECEVVINFVHLLAWVRWHFFESIRAFWLDVILT